jgi:hypothetical protein
VLVPGSEPVPAERLLTAEPAGPGGGGPTAGLCWSFEVDLDAILAAAAKAAPGPGGTSMLSGLSGAGHGSPPARGAAAPSATAPGQAQVPGQRQEPGDASPGQGPGEAGPDQAPGNASPDQTQTPGDAGPGQEPGDASPAPAGGSPGAGSVLLPDEGGLGLDVVAEYLPGSAGLAAWLDQRDPASTSDYDLPAVAAGWRRVAAFAQAREFAAIAQIAVRSAARNEKAGLEEDGRPAAVTPDAAAQVGLALALSPGTAEWWTGQAVTLTWRLPGTGAALAAGQIDAYRARLITEATSLLDEDTARAVEDDVLPGAGELTYAQLRSRLRRAVIIADPQGAEERRRAAERRARVSLYPDDDGTATLTGTSLPAPHAAAAMARITALARALKASGAGGGTDLLRAHIFIGLLLGTLPPIPPPADGGQPSEPSPDDEPSSDEPSPGDPPDDGGRPGSTPPGASQHPGPPPSGRQRPRPPHGSRPSRRDQSPGGPAPHRDESAGQAAGDPLPGDPPASSPRGDATAPLPGLGPPGTQPPRPGPPSSRPPSGSPDPEPPASPPPRSRPPEPRTPELPGDNGSVHGPWPEVPPLTDADAPDPDDGYADPPPEPYDDDRLRYGEDPLDLPDTGPLPAWPPIPGTTSTRPLTTTGASAGSAGERDTTSRARAGAGKARTPGRASRNDSTSRNGGAGRASPVGSATSDSTAADDGTAASPASTRRPGAGMLDLTLSWATIAEFASAPGILGRIGPVTATQARALAAAAAMAPGTRWRVVLTDGHGHAIKTATVTRRLTPATQAGTASSGPASGPALPLAGPHASITGRVSVTIPVTALDHLSAAELAGASTRAAILRAAAKAAAKARRQAAADWQADTGCAHTTASPAYRPPATIRDFIEARDQTCRFPGCRQPAWRGDLDHTTPFHCGGLTCPCNLGPLCRRHHRLKQEHHWALTQASPGTFRWQTSAGRSYATTAHQHSP